MHLTGDIGCLNMGGSSPGSQNLALGIVTATAGSSTKAFAIQGGLTKLLRRPGELYLIPLNQADLAMLTKTGNAIPRFDRALGIRSDELYREVARRIRELNIGGLIVNGGNGSDELYLALLPFLKEYGILSIFTPKTIDADILGVGTNSLGFWSAVQGGCQIVDGFRSNLRSNEVHPIFVVKWMGRGSGLLTLTICMASIGRLFILPEELPDRFPTEFLAEWLALSALKWAIQPKPDWDRGLILSIAEGCALKLVTPGLSEVSSRQLADERHTLALVERTQHILKEFVVSDELISNVRFYAYGHEMLRDAPPVSYDRILGFRYGFEAAKALMSGVDNAVMVLEGDRVYAKPREEIVLNGGPLGTTEVDVEHDRFYLAACQRRSECGISPADLENEGMLRHMAAETQLDWPRFLARVEKVAFIGAPGKKALPS